MYLAITTFKGGAGKSTLAMHLTDYFVHKVGPTLLVDGDPNRSCYKWALREGSDLPFKVVTVNQMAAHAGAYRHIILDSEAHPSAEDLQEFALAAELILIPTDPTPMSLDVTMETVKSLNSIAATNYRVVLNIVPPLPNRDGEEARLFLESEGIPVLRSALRRLACFARAPLSGKTVRTYKDSLSSTAWAQVLALGDEVLETITALQTAKGAAQ